MTKGQPFGALFPAIDVALLHGGLGVTSEAFLAGIPVITSGILLMDQRYWAARIAELGCGSDGVPIMELLRCADQSRPSRVVELLQRALDQREGAGGTLSWHHQAKEVKHSLDERR